MIGGNSTDQRLAVKRFSHEELAAIAHALGLGVGLEPGDIVLEEDEDGSIHGHLFGEPLVSGPLYLVMEQLGQALWSFAKKQVPAPGDEPSPMMH